MRRDFKCALSGGKSIEVFLSIDFNDAWETL